MPPAPVKKAAAKKIPAKKSAAAVKKAGIPAKKAAPASKASAAGLPPAILPIGSGSRRYPAILIYGEPGTGKTVLTGTAPNCLVLEADRGDVSAAVRGSTAKKWTLDDWDDAAEALHWLQNGGDQQFDFVALDTISVFQGLGLDHIMEDLVAVKPHRHVWAPDKGEYGQNMNRLVKYIRDLSKLRCGLIVTAHIQQEVDHEGEYRFMPQVQGKNMPEKISIYFDIIGHMSIRVVEGKEIPRFSALHEGKYYFKDRYDGRVGAIVDPTIPKILRRIENAKPSGRVAKR